MCIHVLDKIVMFYAFFFIHVIGLISSFGILFDATLQGVQKVPGLLFIDLINK